LTQTVAKMMFALVG